MKDKRTYIEKYRKNTKVSKDVVVNDAKKSCEIHLLEAGKMESGKEFVTVTIFVK